MPETQALISSAHASQSPASPGFGW
jgi:hypothetical protein